MWLPMRPELSSVPDIRSLHCPRQTVKYLRQNLEGYLSAFYGMKTMSIWYFREMVYISHPTEYGTLYTKENWLNYLQSAMNTGSPFIWTGARLGYALAAADTDVTLEDVAEYCDVFYIAERKSERSAGSRRLPEGEYAAAFCHKDKAARGASRKRQADRRTV